MRLKALFLVTVVGAALGSAAMPAAAQGYRDPCRAARGDNQAAGLILGGILGGVLGSNVAASGHRHDGTALGAVLGGVVGSEIGRSSTNCNAYPQPYPYNQQRYPSAYGSSRPYSPSPDYGYAPPPDYRYGRRDDEYYRRDMSSDRNDRLYDDDYDDYIENDDYAGRDCSDATQITRLPDGTEIRRTVDACRDMYYGGWKVRD
ncbi:MAG TPA: glycine zipper 2TM domain-containing protein [Hyphomonadaceae bacterium]|jgi:hypothetical protein